MKFQFCFLIVLATFLLFQSTNATQMKSNSIQRLKTQDGIFFIQHKKTSDFLGAFQNKDGGKIDFFPWIYKFKFRTNEIREIFTMELIDITKSGYYLSYGTKFSLALDSDVQGNLWSLIGSQNNGNSICLYNEFNKKFVGVKRFSLVLIDECNEQNALRVQRMSS